MGPQLILNSLRATVFYLAPRLSNVLLFIFIGWRFGPATAGIFTLGVTYLLILSVITRGMDDLIIRKVAQAPESAAGLLAQFVILRIAITLISYVLLWMALGWLLHYSERSVQIILIMTLAALPESIMATAQSVLVGRGNFSLPSLLVGLTNLLKLAAGGAAIWWTDSLVLLAWSSVCVYALGSVVLLWLLLKSLKSVPHIYLKPRREHVKLPSSSPTEGATSLPTSRNQRPVLAFARGASQRSAGASSKSKQEKGIEKATMILRSCMDRLRESLPFMGITTLVGTEGQIDIIMLSSLRGESAVGLYGAATTVTSSLLMLSQAYRQSIYPMMARAVESDAVNGYQAGVERERTNNQRVQLRRLYQVSIRYLALIAFPMTGGLIYVAPQIIESLFGPPFAPTVPILQVLSVAIPFSFLSVPNVRLIFATNAQNYSLRFVAAAFGVNILLNVLLTPAFGGVGAAVARSVSTILLFILSHCYVWSRLMRVNSWPLVTRPLLATAMMIIALLPVPTAPLGVVIGSGIGAYLVSILLVGAISRDDLRILQSLFQKK